MTVIGIDDTDSRTLGMCTTYTGNVIANKIKERNYTVSRTLLIRLNPAAKHKTRGNAAVAIHTDMPVEQAHNIAEETVFEHSRIDDGDTNPGVVTVEEIPKNFSKFTWKCIREIVEITEAEELIKNSKVKIKQSYQGNGRGRIGSVAAIGSWEAFTDWTYERIFYRTEEKWGTDRDVNFDSLFNVADNYYPEAWDTVDRVQNEAVCVPHTPCPILYGIRGDKKEAVQRIGELTQSEEVMDSQLFITNQGTDVHLRECSISNLENDSAYKVQGTVSTAPETREGGHVVFELVDEDGSSIDVIAFEPTKHFRDVVRKLRKGDNIIVCGEVANNTIKIEKMAVIELNTTEKRNPKCDDCCISMSSAGKNQGYRCRKCKKKRENKEIVNIQRELETGWYEVPPCARRHIAKPLIREGEEKDGLNVHTFK